MQIAATDTAVYRGRFAPSPTGPLHFGSLVAAVGSFLQARAHNGEWHLRIEDLDRPRVVGTAADNIMRTLERLQLHWDGPVRYQQKAEFYADAFSKLVARAAVYACRCSRREIADSSIRGIDGPVYPGTCRTQTFPPDVPTAWRVHTADAQIEFNDRIQGTIARALGRDIGDFVVRRADGRFTYQLAVVADDAALGVTEVVRGADLLESTARQIYLQRLLDLPTPRYAHLPVAIDIQGQKLSKQTHAAAIDAADASALIVHALGFLSQAPPPALMRAGVAEVWAWARTNWDIARVPRVLTKAVDGWPR